MQLLAKADNERLASWYGSGRKCKVSGAERASSSMTTYDLKVNDTGLVLSWGRAQNGVIKSVSVEDECMPVLVQNELCIYKLTEHQQTTDTVASSNAQRLYI